MTKRRRTRRSKRRSRGTRLISEFQAYGVYSPNTSMVIGWSRLPSLVQDSTFRLIHFSISGSSLDTASANKFQDGPAFIQLRQLSPDGKTTLRCSRVFALTGNKTFSLRTDRIEYPGSWRGDALVSLDVLCPKKGYERGIACTLYLKFTYDHIPLSEACPNIEAVPTCSTSGLHHQQATPSVLSIETNFSTLSLGRRNSS